MNVSYTLEQEYTAQSLTHTLKRVYSPWVSPRMHAELKHFTADFSSLQSFIPLCTTGGGGRLSLSHTQTHVWFLSNSFLHLPPPPPSSLLFCLSSPEVHLHFKTIALSLSDSYYTCLWGVIDSSSPLFLLIPTVLPGNNNFLQQAIFTSVSFTSLFLSVCQISKGQAVMLAKWRDRVYYSPGVFLT